MTASKTHSIVFMPSGRRGVFPEGMPLLEVGRALGVDIDSVCGGRGRCGRCQVVVCEGTFLKEGVVSSSSHVTPMGAVEEGYASKKPLAPGRRLACQACLCGDVVVDVPSESQLHGQVIRKEAGDLVIERDVAVRLYYIEIAPCDLAAPVTDEEAVLSALEAQWGVLGAVCSHDVLKVLQGVRKEGGGCLTCAVHHRLGEAPHRPEVVAVWPNLCEAIYGVALDVGSTTLAGHLCSLETGEVVASMGRMNPQIRYGEDVMSRVSYAMMHEDGRAVLTQAITEAIAGLIADLAQKAGIGEDLILEIVLVGNPIMHHLFLGLDPRPLGEAPFVLATDKALTLPAKALGVSSQNGAYVYVLPCIAGHVGADTAAVVLDQMPVREGPARLVVDIGTNAEIVVRAGGRMLACSSPTGPALEGAQITCGQRAAPGAIERFRLDPQTFVPRYRVIGCSLWSDEPGFEEAVSKTGVTGMCGSGILEVVGELFLAGIVTKDGVIRGDLEGQVPGLFAQGRTFAFMIRQGPPALVITQNDIRAIQLAKAALYAGIQLLWEALGSPPFQSISLAGAFGSHIDPAYAMVLGLIPNCPLGQVSACGNAAGEGARRALLNAGARDQIEALVPHVEKIETALSPDFQRHFVDAMAIPHATHIFSALADRFVLPQTEAHGGEEPLRRRRRVRLER